MPFDVPHGSLRSKSAAPPCHGVRAVFLPLSGDGIPRKLIPGLIPIAQRIAVPRLANRKRGQTQLLPNRLRAFHILAHGQSQWRHWMFERSVNKHCPVQRLRPGFRGVTSLAIRFAMLVFGRVLAVADRTQYRVGTSWIYVLAY